MYSARALARASAAVKVKTLRTGSSPDSRTPLRNAPTSPVWSSAPHDVERMTSPSNSASTSNGGAALVTVPFGTVKPSGVIARP